MSNFNSTISANETAMNSAGSAARENATYMDSLEAKMSALKQSFQELSNSIVDNDLVKILLDVGKAGLDIANTPVGKFALVAGGITAVTVALASMWNVLKLGQAFSAVFMGAAGGPLIAVIAGVSALVALFPSLKSWYDKTTMSLEEYNAELTTSQEQLETNKKRIQEINGLPWNEKTNEILSEKDALIEENKELQIQIDKLDELSKKKAEKILSSGGTVKSNKYQLSSLGDGYVDVFGTGIQQAPLEDLDFATYDDLVDYLDTLIPNASKKTREELEALGVIFKEVEGDIYLVGDAYQEALIKRAKFLTEALKNEKSLTEEQLIEYGQIVKQLGEVSNAYIELGQETDESVIVLGELTKAYDKADAYVSDYVQSLVKEQIQAGKTGKELYNLVAAQIAANDAKLNFSQQIQALKTLATMAGVASELINSLDSQSYNTGLRRLTNQGMSLEEAKGSMLNNIWDRWNKTLEVAPNPNPLGSGSGSGSGGSSKTKTDPIEEQSKLFKDQISILKSRLDILQKSGASQEEQVAQMEKIQNALHEQAEWYRSKGLDDNSQYLSELGLQWWDYSNQIKAIYDKIAEEAREAQKAQLESQKSAYEALFNYMVDNIDERINALQEERKVEEDNWNAKIQALKDENDEIERQIELETLQSNLAKARQSQVMVYKDGRFQYAKNIDEISQAQTALDSYKREEALRQETTRLENLKNIAIKAIDDQIEQWEGYKLEWSSVVDSYTKDQDKLIIEQQLGIKLEGENWQERIKNLADYVSQYKSLMSSLSDLSSTSSEKKSTVGTPVKDSGSKTNIPSTPIPESKPSQDIKTVISQDIRKKKYATGTLSAAGGLSLVGEGGGPELRVLNQGDGIIPADITRNLWALGSNPYAYMGNAIKSLAGGVSGAMNQIFQIDKLELPNATDAPSLVNGLVRYAHQYSAQRT